MGSLAQGQEMYEEQPENHYEELIDQEVDTEENIIYDFFVNRPVRTVSLSSIAYRG